MKRQVFDQAFKQIAVELSYAKGSVKVAAAELGIDPGRLSKWRQSKQDSNVAPIEKPSLTAEQLEIKRLQKELKEAQLERDIWSRCSQRRQVQKRPSASFPRATGIFRFINEYREVFPVEKMCKVMQVSVSGYYYWLKNPISSRAIKEQELLVNIHKIYDDSKKRYGSPRITCELRELGIQVSRPRVARLMKKANIKSIIRKKYRIQTTDSNHQYTVAENHLNRDFSAQTIGQKWVSDLTYIRTGAGWLYLTAILDQADRKVVGWALSETMKTTDTTIAAWKMAIKNRPISQNLLFHSDRGVQYACIDFRKQLNHLPVLQSMSRKGNCWDNAVAESFFKTLKTELVYHTDYATKQQAKLAIFEYIEGWYNKRRRHSALGNRSPQQYQVSLEEKRTAA